MTGSAVPRRVVIIGSGFSGLCLGVQLQKHSIPFTILEKAGSLGGTWRDNTYPGAACDTPAFSYCFSFEQKTDWSRKWAPQCEILGYMEHVAKKYGLLDHIRFDTEVASARFDAERALWCIRTRAGEELQAEILVSGVGQLNRPKLPALPGLELFEGEHFHSARWNHGYDLAGKRVGVVGNAASAIQFVPEIAPVVGELTIFQRSANWMLPRNDRPYSEAEKRRFERHPLLSRAYRSWIWAAHELRFPVFRGNQTMGGLVERLARRSIREQITDPVLQRALVPNYPVGGKRILISDDYYASLERENVRVVTAGIESVTSNGVVADDGVRFELDALIFATGFETTDFLAPIAIEGLDHRCLESEWKQGARAYLGLSVSGFPNFFMMYGPNTNLGHNSIIFMIECQTRYIMDAIRQLEARDLASIDVRRDEMDAYNEQLEEKLAKTVWASTEQSWYKTADGSITNNWSGPTVEYWWRTRRADLTRYQLRHRSADPQPAQPPGAEPGEFD